jgi:hypothetical protein
MIKKCCKKYSNMRFFMKKGDKKQRYESVTATTYLCYEQIAEI